MAEQPIASEAPPRYAIWLALALTAAVYAPTLSFPFVYDDLPQIVAIEGRTTPEYARRACERLIAKTVIPRDLQISLPALERTLEAMHASGQVSAESILPNDILFPVAPV